MPLELKQEGAGVGFELRFAIGSKDQIIEQFRIKESKIELACVPEGGCFALQEILVHWVNFEAISLDAL